MMLISFKKTTLSFLFFPLLLFAQESDTTNLNSNQASTLFFFDKETYQNQFEFADAAKPIDHSIKNFQNYLERNHLGNSGLAFNPIFASPSDNRLGFNYSKNNYQNYFTSPQNIPYFDTKNPYTDLFYILGSKKEQIFDMKFSYNIKNNWNLTAAFKRIRSDGFYSRQNTNNNSYSISSNYKALNNRYALLANVIYNKAENAENGGIVKDSTVLSNLGINLNSANRSTANQTVFFKQYLNFGKKAADSTKNNSILPASRLILTSKFENYNYVYKDDDPLSGYYTSIMDDSINTYDSINYYLIENEIKWKRLNNQKYRGAKDYVGIALSLQHQFVEVKQNEIHANYNNIIAGTELYNTYTKNNFWWLLSSKYAFNGYNKDNYYAGLRINKAIIDSLNWLTFKAETKSQRPDFIYNRYSSNNFFWDNSLEMEKENHLELSFNAKKPQISLGVHFLNYENLGYFDDAAIAQQYKSPVSLLRIFLHKDFSLWKFHLNNKINYQYLPNLTVIRLPEFVFEHSLYFESEMFKSAMKMQIGASVYYVSGYYANAYMPATAQFYLQNDNNTGNYPFIDFFINAKIKAARIFFKIDHLNSGWSGENYALTPNYPLNTRAFKLGISWRFFD